MNNTVLHMICVMALVLLLLANRTTWTDPKLPLSGIAVVVGLWLLLACYTFLTSLWVLYQQQWSGGVMTATSLILSCVPVALLLTLLVRAQQVPAIHDITTDVVSPPVFHHAKRARHPSHNLTDYVESNAELQTRAYPKLTPLLLERSPSEVLVLVEKVVIDLGWQVHGVDVENRVVEAYDRSALFGFVDDIVIRITPMEGNQRSRVDIRSASRIGVSDLGANAQRIGQFLKQLSQLAEQ